jgi:hypothetical protein
MQVGDGRKDPDASSSSSDSDTEKEDNADQPEVIVGG